MTRVPHNFAAKSRAATNEKNEKNEKNETALRLHFGSFAEVKRERTRIGLASRRRAGEAPPMPISTRTLAEIEGLRFVLNGDERGDWIEWTVDDSTVCAVARDTNDLSLEIAASLGAEEDLEVIAAVRARLEGSMVGAMMSRSHLYARGKREFGTAWTVEA